MRLGRRRAAGFAAGWALAVAGVAGIAGCGSEAEPPTPRPAESAERLPSLDRGWRPVVNEGGGFSFGLPPGWSTRRRGTASLVRSGDGLVVISIGADRTSEALALDLEQFAARTLVALPGFEDPLEPAPPRSVEHRYDGVLVEARGTPQGGGERQSVTVVALRRPELVNLTVAIAARDVRAAASSQRLAAELVRTLRSRPIG